METVYLFIDGGYLRRVYADGIKGFFGVEGELDVAAVKGNVGSSVKRVFYYDCLDDVQRQGETEAQRRARVSTQEMFFDRIQSLPGFHVRLGVLSGKPGRLRQKKVDVLLTVEMLENAFRKNMDKALLLAGDLDFAPVVDSLVRLGTYVEVMYEPRSAAKNLYSAADSGLPVNLYTLFLWSTVQFKKQHPLPTAYSSNIGPPGDGRGSIRRGKVEGTIAHLDRSGDRFVLRVYQYDRGNPGFSLVVEGDSEDAIEKYFEAMYGHIEWE